MRIVKQPLALSITNKDDNVRKLSRRHGNLLPSTIRCLIVGPSNCGKTNAMICLLEDPNGLRFENVCVFSKSLYQPKYGELRELLRPIKGIGYDCFDNCDNILPPEEAKRNTVFIFDDVACDKQNIMRQYFCMGRHKNVDSFYLCQSYTHIPKHLIRDNTNMLVIFKQDDLNLKHIYEDHINTDMSFNKFKEICSLCWRDKYGALVIDKESDINSGRYRKGFDHFIQDI